ncbi:MAG: carbohydrate esterase [Sphaerochaeta sp.]|nr:MAG: carbohydrate esterase [Sphaerochaeta sp.]
MLDFLVVTAHPDDESAIAGFLLSAKKQGYKTGIICLTKGESGGFATKEERVLEFEEATALLGFDWVRILDFPDAGIEVSSSAVETLIPLFRETEAKTIITLHPEDYHPDHRAVAALVDRAIFVAGLKKHSTDDTTWHPAQVLSISLDARRATRRADIVYDISDVQEEWRAFLKCYPSQKIAQFVEIRARYYGLLGGYPLAEGFFLNQPLRLDGPGTLIHKAKRN